MLIRYFIGALLFGLAAGLLALVGSGSSNDPFASMGMFGACTMILAAIVGGLLLALSLSAGTDRGVDRTQSKHPR